MHRRAGIANVLRLVFGNPDLRRIGLAYAGFNAAEWAVWIAVLVYAYDHGGAQTAAIAAVVQLVPSGLVAPFAARFADRGSPARVLAGGYLAQAATMGLTALALFAGAPLAAVFVLAALAASATTITRPAHAVLVPALVGGLDELTSVNVVLGWIESISLLAAPAIAGVLLAVSVPGTVFAVMAAVALAAAALVARVAGPAKEAPGAGGAGDAALADALAGAKTVRDNAQARLLVGILGVQFVVIGALDVLFVVLAIDVLALGDAGAGYLGAAFGAGGVIGIAVTVRLIGRARLAPALVVASLVWSLALLALGLWQATLGAFALLAVAGAGRAVLDIATRTLLQRSAPTHVLAGVFGVLETLDAVGLALGAILAPLLVSVLGPGTAVAGLAVLLPLMLLLVAPRLATLDAHAAVPVIEISLLRSHGLFAALGAPVLERLARELTAITLRPGERIIREGQAGERYYVVADGRLEVTRSGVRVATVGRGDGVGEISLLARVPCTATVTALTGAQLFAIQAQAFIEAVSAHPASAGAAERLVRERLQSAST